MAAPSLGRGSRPVGPEDGVYGGNKYWQARHRTPGQQARGRGKDRPLALSAKSSLSGTMGSRHCLLGQRSQRREDTQPPRWEGGHFESWQFGFPKPPEPSLRAWADGTSTSPERNGFSYCKAQALGQVGFSSGGSWALDLRCDSCGARAKLFQGM